MEKEQFVRKPKNIEQLEKELLELEGSPTEDIKEIAVEEVSKPEEVEETTQEMKPLSKEEETFKKRYGDLRRHTEKLKKEYEAKLAEATNNTTTVQPKTAEEVREWMEKYPDVAGIVMRIAQEQAGTDKISERLRVIEEREEELKLAESQRKLRELHPDFDEITSENSDLHKWAKDQPEWMQDILYTGDDVQAVSRILSLYKVEAGIKTPQAKAKETAQAVSAKAKSVPSEGVKGKTFTESQIEKMSLQEYEALEKEILAAQREGRIIRDVRGAAY